MTRAFQTPQFRTGVDVFQLEVSVFDRNHEPVRGLTSANFSVFENGKLQPIVNFEEIEFPEYDGPLTEAIEDTAPDVAMPRYTNRRLISVVLDDFNWPVDPRTCMPLDPDREPVAKEIVKYIVDSMGAADLVSVNLTRDLRYFPDFTNNHWKLVGNVAEFSVPGCAEKMYLNELARRNLRSLGLLPAIDELIDRLAKYPQHQKMIVGVVNGRGRVFAGGNSVGVGGAGSLDTRWMEIIRAAQRAGISVSLVDVLPLDPMYRPSDLFRTITESTGGVAVVSANDLSAGLRQIYREHHTYYLIGYQQSGPKDGKFRRLDVRVDLAGATVRARSGYTAPGGLDIVKQPLFYDPDVDAAIAKLDPGDVSRRLFTRALAEPGVIHAITEIASSEFVGGRWARGADVELVVTRATGSVVGKATSRIEPGSRSAAVDIPLRDAQGQAVDQSAGPFHVTSHAASATASLDDGVDAESGGTLLGEAVISRAASGSRAVLRPVAERKFLRTERIHIEWPLLKSVDQRHAAILRRTGEPLPYTLELRERAENGRTWLVTEFLLSPLNDGVYAIELSVQSGATEAERKIVAFRLAQ